MRRHILAAMALAALGSTAAHAVDNGIYVGASVGEPASSTTTTRDSTSTTTRPGSS